MPSREGGGRVNHSFKMSEQIHYQERTLPYSAYNKTSLAQTYFVITVLNVICIYNCWQLIRELWTFFNVKMFWTSCF